ncbi:MAG: ABC transporter ATP-binding protein/permease [Spirochaetes bacterium]|nr:ABC transporter ATP-binding protein/permease [Spirochaetota bacterium]
MEIKKSSMAKAEDIISNKEASKFLWGYIKRNFLQMIFGILVLVVVDLLQLIIPKYVKESLDLLSMEYFSEKLILIIFIKIMILSFLMAFLRVFWRLGIIGASRKIEKQVREDMFLKVQSLSFNYFNKTKTGDLMALMINDVNAIRMATGPSFIALTDALFMGTMSLIFMFALSVKITILSIIPLGFIAIISAIISPRLRTFFSQVQESFSSISMITQEVFSGIRVVKGFNQEKDELINFEKRCDDYVSKNLKLVKIWGIFFPIVIFLSSSSISLLYLFGGRGVMIGEISLGTLVAMTMYLGQFVWPMMAIGWLINMFQRGIASSKRILVLLKEVPEISDNEKTDFKIDKIEGDILIKDLTFSYNGEKEVLKGINLHIKKGNSLGIMGRPGSGKSTLISILFHLFNVEDGKVFIDGYDINKIPIKTLRKSIGYVPQDSFLFSDSIKNNITFGIEDDKVDFEIVEKYGKIASIHKDIINFPAGYETIVGERGITLSGGQKQRIAIARALIINPSILILDDALSSVDANTEREILNNLKEEIRKRTSIIIAHRVSTVKDCDEIIILDEGKIIERGTHEELLKLDGYYAKLYELQKLEEIVFEKE